MVQVYRFLGYTLLMVCLACLASGAGESNTSKRYESLIGMRYVELPRGFKHLIGTMLEDKRYGVTVVEQGTEKIAWLGKIVGYGKDGKPEWEVLDILVFPPLQKGQELADICNNEIRGRKYTIAIATFNDAGSKRKTIRIHQAWQLNFQSKKFESISTQGIECIDPGEE